MVLQAGHHRAFAVIADVGMDREGVPDGRIHLAAILDHRPAQITQLRRDLVLVSGHPPNVSRAWIAPLL